MGQFLGKSSIGAREDEVRAAATRAQFATAVRAPASMASNAHDYDPDQVVGAAVENSAHLVEVLSNLVLALGPNHALTVPVVKAEQAAVQLSLLRESWVEHCDRDAPADRDEQWRALGREFPAPAKVRAWPCYEVARARTLELGKLLAETQPQLADFTGYDVFM